MEGNIDKVREMVKNAPYVINESLLFGCSPLHTAMCSNNTDVVRILLDYPSTRLDILDSVHGSTPLHTACGANSAAVIPLFGNDRRCSIDLLNMKDSDGNTALMIGAQQGYL